MIKNSDEDTYPFPMAVRETKVAFLFLSQAFLDRQIALPFFLETFLEL